MQWLEENIIFVFATKIISCAFYHHNHYDPQNLAFTSQSLWHHQGNLIAVAPCLVITSAATDYCDFGMRQRTICSRLDFCITILNGMQFTPLSRQMISTNESRSIFQHNFIASRFFVSLIFNVLASDFFPILAVQFSYNHVMFSFLRFILTFPHFYLFNVSFAFRKWLSQRSLLVQCKTFVLQSLWSKLELEDGDCGTPFYLLVFCFLGL